MTVSTIGSHALQGGFDNAPLQSATAFRGIMTAMARPGVVQQVAGATAPAPVSAAAACLILTLCDPETGLYLAPGFDGAAVQDWVRFHTGAQLVGPKDCDFALGDWAALGRLSQYPTGTPEYPDRSATLIVETDDLGKAQPVSLRGPGIQVVQAFNLPDIAAFQLNARAFPLGLDFFFTSGSQLAALPRTTKVAAPCM